MNTKVSLTLLADDAAPILYNAAEMAARYGALCDYITIRTYDSPGRNGPSLADSKKEWLAKFLSAKRIVESFGVEYEPTSEGETMTVHIPDPVLWRKRHKRSERSRPIFAAWPKKSAPSPHSAQSAMK